MNLNTSSKWQAKDNNQNTGSGLKTQRDLLLPLKARMHILSPAQATLTKTFSKFTDEAMSLSLPQDCRGESPDFLCPSHTWRPGACAAHLLYADVNSPLRGTSRGWQGQTGDAPLSHRGFGKGNEAGRSDWGPLNVAVFWHMGWGTTCAFMTMWQVLWLNGPDCIMHKRGWDTADKYHKNEQCVRQRHIHLTLDQCSAAAYPQVRSHVWSIQWKGSVCIR